MGLFMQRRKTKKIVTVSIQEDDPSYKADGYVSFGIVYTFMSLTMWISPAVIVIIGRKLTLMVGAFCYIAFISFCYFENTFITYLGSTLTGIGAALLWTAQANYIVLNSEVGEVYQGISTFMVLFECSFLAGNTAVYFEFNDPNKRIDRSTRQRIVFTLLGFVLLSVVMLYMLKSPIRKENKEEINSPVKEVKTAFSMLTSKTFLILCMFFTYGGLNLTFLSTLGASMGFSKYLSNNSKEYVPISGFVQGFGELIGCGLSLIAAKRTKPKSKFRPVFTLGCIASFLSYGIAFVGIPDTAVYSYTDDIPIVKLPIWCLLTANALVGFADACTFIEIYQILGSLYPNDSAPAFAVAKFIRCIAAAISFYYSNLIGLRMQLILLTVFASLGLLSNICLVMNQGTTRLTSSNKNNES